MKKPQGMPASYEAASFRKQLHRHPELSGHEVITAKTIAEQLRCFGLEPVTQVGGHGLFCTIEGDAHGETTLIRADFDAVPVDEKASHDHVSQHPGVMHACGHDGHTASLLSVAKILSQTPPQKGKVVLLFQPAEEVGVGASAMLNSPEFKELEVDNVFAYHNLPGHPLHEVVVKDGTFACASTGISVNLEGKTSHAAYPENGISPVSATVDLLQYLQDLPSNYPDKFSLVTIVSTQLGEEAFGVSAGSSKVMATMRSDCNTTFQDMKHRLTERLKQVDLESDLTVSYSWHEPFNAAVNSRPHVDLIKKQAADLGLSITELKEPMRWSEDFSEFLLKSPGVLFGIGSGLSHPELHNPDYDFPDEILETASSMFIALVREIHG